MTGCLKLWDTGTGEITTTPLLEQNVASATFSPNGKSLLVMEYGQGRQWDASSLQPMSDSYVSILNFILTSAQTTMPFNQFTKGIFSPGGTTVLGIGAGQFNLWDAATSTVLGDPIPNHSTGPVTAIFSPDGTKLVTSGKNVVRLYETRPPKDTPTPDWLPVMGDVIAGEQLNETGQYVSLSPDDITQKRNQLQQVSGNDFWATLNHWYFADPWTRTLAPHSKVTTAEYVQQLIRDGSADSVAELQAFSQEQPEIQKQISAALSPATPATTNPAH
jgi:hypothetical protein